MAIRKELEQAAVAGLKKRIPGSTVRWQERPKAGSKSSDGNVLFYGTVIALIGNRSRLYQCNIWDGPEPGIRWIACEGTH